MKREILKVKFKVFRENINITMDNLMEFCETVGVTYTYSIKHRFWPMKSVIVAEFEGKPEYIKRIEMYIHGAHGIS